MYAAAIQRFVVTPNEQAAETPYMTHNIAATRQAFNLAAVRTRNFSGDAVLTRDDIERSADTLKNVRLWDHQPLLETFGQIQELRTYYDFASVDNDRYIDQRRTATGDALGARAEFREPSEPHVDQRAPHVHPRLRHHAGAGERGDAGRAADSLRQGHSAAVVGGERHRRERAEHLFRRADEQLRARQHKGKGVSLLEGRRRRERRDRL